MPMALTKTQFQPIYINDLIEIILRCVNMIKEKRLIPMNVLGPKSLHYMRLLSSQIYSEERQWLYHYQIYRINSSVYFGKNAWSNVDVKRQYNFHECSFDCNEK